MGKEHGATPILQETFPPHQVSSGCCIKVNIAMARSGFIQDVVEVLKERSTLSNNGSGMS